jgi:hypothetical protein
VNQLGIRYSAKFHSRGPDEDGTLQWNKPIQVRVDPCPECEKLGVQKRVVELEPEAARFGVGATQARTTWFRLAQMRALARWPISWVPATAISRQLQSTRAAPHSTTTTETNEGVKSAWFVRF